MKRILSSRLIPFLIICSVFNLNSQDIPLPEHPRPDFERPDWINLNGQWDFEFDSLNIGEKDKWFSGKTDFSKAISVPFPWGSKLSGIEDEADIGWYKRQIHIPENWKEKRTFINIGASDWKTDVWLDGIYIGSHEGGYVPFSFELSEHLKYGTDQKLVIKVDDKRRMFTLYGKQGYGNARGIWQTPYLEARGNLYFEAVHFTPDIHNKKVHVKLYLNEEVNEITACTLNVKQPNEEEIIKIITIETGRDVVNTEFEFKTIQLWELDNPNLYEVEISMGNEKINSYFGMREISVVDLPGTDYPYIALNGKPIYLQMALDQSYHPEGFYTFPSDQFIKEEIERSKSIGLNGIRTHIKVEVPRKLYWADKLGLLVMEDLPNSWGEPDDKMKAESIYTLKEMIKRDYNHPSIFSWVDFNETWGLHTTVGKNDEGRDIRKYLPETQDWVASMYYLTKSLDQTRLVEDNSICCGRGHTETDINSWHAYLPGWEWDKYLSNMNENTYPGSSNDFEEGFTQGNQPNINSECGNVWGYTGSTGDIDWSWDYHRMLNSFRKYPKIAGWLYTEHHDVINEWNGYWRFDRSEKMSGMEDIVEGMTLNDLHSTVYLSPGNEICKTVNGGEVVDVPLFLSAMTDQDYGDYLTVSYELSLLNSIGEIEVINKSQFDTQYKPWIQRELNSLKIKMPEVKGLATLKFWVKDKDGNILQRNFMHFDIESGNLPENVQVYSVDPLDFKNSEWTIKQWDVLDGKKVNGAGKGFFEYDISIDNTLKVNDQTKAFILFEASAKELFVKDRVEFNSNQDYMKGSVVAPSSNPNSYPMTDETLFPSTISVSIEGKKVQIIKLEDDPADHRGVLSWHNQIKDRKLREAGSYGYLIKVSLTREQLDKAIQNGKISFKVQSEGEGGLAIYGDKFGRYPLDPTLLVKN